MKLYHLSRIFVIINQLASVTFDLDLWPWVVFGAN